MSPNTKSIILLVLTILIIKSNYLLAQCKSDIIIKNIKESQYNLLKTSIISTKHNFFKKQAFERKGVINIKTGNKTVTFKSNTNVDEDNDGYRKYEYMYYIDSIKKHVVKFTYFEGNYFYLIDNSTGKVDTLDNEPIIFNNKIVVIYQDMEDADTFSTINFYCIKNKKLKLLNIKKEKWVASKIDVTIDHKILIQAVSNANQQKSFILITF